MANEGQPNSRQFSDQWLLAVLVSFLLVLFVAILAGVFVFPEKLGLKNGLSNDVQPVQDFSRTAPAPDVPLAKWIQLVPSADGCWAAKKSEYCPAAVLVRAIFDSQKPCPVLYFDQSLAPDQPMNKRDNPWPDDFPVTVCEALLRATELPKIVRFPDGNVLSVPQFTVSGNSAHSYLNPQRIVFVGDTGCRWSARGQPCDYDVSWPFRNVASVAAQLPDSARTKTDLVVHVGDYLYGERAGTADWEFWQTEFFEPARPLLSTAPWIFVRGNHEICFNSAGRGWFLFFDYSSRNQTRVCHPDKHVFVTPPYAMDLADGLRVVVMDTSGSNKHSEPKDFVRKEYSRQIESDLAALTSAHSKNWLLTHVPVFGLEQPDQVDPEKSVGQFVPGPTEFLRSLGTAHSLNAIGKFNAVISGDRHGFQWVRATKDGKPFGPPQLIFGHGGVKLDDEPAPKSEMKLTETTGEELVWTWDNVRKFGFAVANWKQTQARWDFEVWTSKNGEKNNSFNASVACRLDVHDSDIPCKPIAQR